MLFFFLMPFSHHSAKCVERQVKLLSLRNAFRVPEVNRVAV